MSNRNHPKQISRRTFLIGSGAATLLASLAACGPSNPSSSATQGGGAAPTSGSAAAPSSSSGPVTITIIDIAGNLQLTKGIIDEYAANNAGKIAKVEYTKATAPELTSKIKAQQNAKQVDIAIVLTGTDGLSAGIEQNLWVKLLPDYEAKFPNLMQNYLQPAAQDLAQGFGITIAFGNYGPMFTYNPQKVPTPPQSPQELLDFAKSNNGQVMYARPANSGPGRSLLMGLPYMLGDSNPKDPEKGWDKTWSYLQELHQYIEYYPSGTTATMKELGEGSRAMVASTMGWDLNPRILGTVPKEFKVLVLGKEHLVADAHFAALPQGLDDARLQATLDLLAFMLTPEQQAKTYDQGYFYPGPAVKNATLDMAPADSKTAIASVARPEFDELIKSAKIQMPLDAPSLVKAFAIWDERVGGNKVKQ
jgi:putative spermidine/putrescine transport system substrate-binding protein